MKDPYFLPPGAETTEIRNDILSFMETVLALEKNGKVEPNIEFLLL